MAVAKLLDALGSISSLSWSPDGERLAFGVRLLEEPDYMEIWVLDVEATISGGQAQVSAISEPRLAISFQDLAWRPLIAGE